MFRIGWRWGRNGLSHSLIGTQDGGGWTLRNSGHGLMKMQSRGGDGHWEVQDMMEKKKKWYKSWVNENARQRGWLLGRFGMKGRSS